MLAFKDEGVGIRRTFGNPGGNFIFCLFCFARLEHRLHRDSTLSLFKYIPCKMLDFRDEGMGY